MRCKVVGGYITDDAVIAAFIAVSTEEHDGRRAEDTEVFVQGLSLSSSAVTSALSRVTPSSAACTAGSEKVNASISLHDTHQSA